MLGQIRIGRYEVVAALGATEMGKVYKAIDPQTERAVAIKTIDRDFLHEERAEFEERFYREVAGRLRHANIVAIHDVGEADDIAYVAMEYLEGQTLRELLDCGMVPPLETIVDIATGAANALDYAHENGVVHGDVKPENILITAAHDVKIMNFGAAQVAAASPPEPGSAPEAARASAYLAPEQLAGGSPDGRTDIFALGVVVYEMLTGATPFAGDGPGAVADKVLKQTPLPPSALSGEVPSAFDPIVGRALAKRPRDRYQTALAFARDLQDAEPGRRNTAHESDGRRATALAASATGPGGRQGALAVVPPARAARATAQPAAPGRRAQQDVRRLLLVVPVVIVAALAIYPQGRHARDELAASEPRPAALAPSVSVPPTRLPPPPIAPPATTVAAPDSVSPSAPAESRRPAKPGRLATLEASASATVPPPVSAPPPKATLALAISPWGEVYVDGRRVGVSPPLSTLQLEPGKHRVEIRNQTFEPYRDTVSLESGEPLRIKHKFR